VLTLISTVLVVEVSAKSAGGAMSYISTVRAQPSVCRLAEATVALR